jgi:hypothetical protein
MRDPLHDLSEYLLGAGLSPSRVRRYVRELSEHRDDLAESLLAQGLTPDEAASEAQRRLGGMEALALPMLTDRRLLSRAGRWPAIFYVFLPLACQAGLACLGVAVLAIAAGTPLRADIDDLANILALVWLAVPVALSWLTLSAAWRRRSRLGWPVLGAVIGVGLATALQLEVTLSRPDLSGEISAGLTAPALGPALLLLGAAVLPFLLARRKAVS